MNKLKQLFPYIFFFFFSVFLIWIYFYGLKSGEFIFSGDQFLRLSFSEAYVNSFFLRKMESFGVFNSWQQIVQIWDFTYYLISYKLGLSLIQVEKTQFFIALFLSFVVSFFGFKKLCLLFKISQNNYKLIAITIWYCLNPYTLVMWHGGIYNIGFAITYALAPLVLYYFDLSVFSDTTRLKNKLICAILMFFSCFVFWLFAVVVFFLFFYYLLKVVLNKELFIKSIKHLFILGLVFIPLSSFVIFTILHEYLNNSSDINANFYASFQSQQGGMWYSFLMLFSWGIYNVWTPRSLYPFGSYFLSSAYKTVTLSIYFLILVGASLLYFDQQKSENSITKNLSIFIKSKKNRLLFIFSSLFLISIFFAKAAQPPFGGIFLFLYNHMPFFSVFRSADHRFGFAVVLSVSLLLIIASQKYKAYLFVLILLLLSVVQVYPLYFGNAVRGENIEDKYYDRITNITPEYQQVSDFLNAQKGSLSYILTIPSVEYGVYKLDFQGKEHLVGQDLLPKIINKPFVYLSASSGIDVNASKQLYQAIKEENFDELKKFPIEFIILRKDIVCMDCPVLTKDKLDESLTKLLENKLFIVYKVNDFFPFINVSKGKVSYKMLSPVMFKLKLDNITDKDELDLMLSFNKNWHIYITQGEQKNYLFGESVFDNTHKTTNGYANSWVINTSYIKKNTNKDNYIINKDGTINFEAVIYYQPQNWYYFYAVISMLMFSTYLIIIFSKKYKHA